SRHAPLSSTCKRAIFQLPSFQYVAHSAFTLACPELRRVLPERRATPFLSISSALFRKNAGCHPEHLPIFGSPLATRHSPLSALESALTKTVSRNSFRIRTYEKRRGGTCFSARVPGNRCAKNHSPSRFLLGDGPSPCPHRIEN